MKFRFYSMVFLTFFCSAYSVKKKKAVTRDQELTITNNVVALSQSDFDTGPYRITEPGYYYFTEDVSFDPISPTGGSGGVDGGRTSDRPRTGAWFAGISVECNNVVIDLNTKTFECTKAFVDNHEFKVFSMIELNNSPFPHLVFAYSGETELKTAHNVTIKNGTLGNNSHHGIHGNDNSNIRIHDLVCKDWEVAGISLNGLQSGEIKNVTVTGVEHQIQFTGFLALINSALIELQTLVDGGDTAAQSYLDDLQTFKDNLTIPERPEGTHDGNCYGIFINRVVDVGPIPDAHCEDGKANCILLEDVNVCNIKADIIETVAMVEKSTGNVLKGSPFGVMRWVDAFDNDDNFAPNAVLKAQAYVTRHALHAFPEHQATVAFLDNILSSTPSASVFYSQVEPSFNTDFAGHTNKGVFGIRVDCGRGVTLKRCNVLGIENVGQPGTLLSDIPGASQYPALEQKKYTGNEVFGISSASIHNARIIDTKVAECSSINGSVYGFNLGNHAEANYFVNCTSNDHVGLRDDNDVVNPSSRVYGYYLGSHANANQFENCESKLLSSPRESCGFWVAGTKSNRFEHCVAENNVATSSALLANAKYAIGFKSLGSECTVFNQCRAIGMHCSGEEGYSGTSASVSAGFLLEQDGSNDLYSSITNSVALCQNGGAGTGVGILLNGATQANITGNESGTNHADTSNGTGYGIQDYATDCTSMILKNVAYGNSTRNYDVTFADAAKSLPVNTALYNDVDNLRLANEWKNISLELAPGVEYTGSNGNTTVFVRQVVRN